MQQNSDVSEYSAANVQGKVKTTKSLKKALSELNILNNMVLALLLVTKFLFNGKSSEFTEYSF